MAGHKNTGWTVDSSARSCQAPRVHVLYLLYMIIRSCSHSYDVSFCHIPIRTPPNAVSIIIEFKQALVMKGHIAQNSGEQLLVLCMSILSMLYAWSDDAVAAEWSRDSAAAICNVSSPSQCPVCPGPGSHYRSLLSCSAPQLLSSAPRHSFSRHILDCGGGQGMVTGQVTGTTHCT